MKRKKAEEGPTEDGGGAGGRISRRRNSLQARLDAEQACCLGLKSKQGAGNNAKGGAC